MTVLLKMTPEQAIEELRKVAAMMVNQSPARCAVSLGELNKLLDKVAGRLTPENVQDAIVGLLETYVENNPGGGGVPSANLWTKLRELVPSVGLPEVENAITELIRGNKIHTRRGMVTTYLPGRDPELNIEDNRAPQDNA